MALALLSAHNLGEMMKASEKYAEVGEDRPRCKCHDELMQWAGDKRERNGGHWICGVKRSAYTKAHYHKHRDLYKTRANERTYRLRRELKIEAGGVCIRCGYDRCLAALQWHHRDPSQKLFNIAEVGYRPIQDVRDELPKCDLICANCHFEIHHGVE